MIKQLNSSKYISVFLFLFAFILYFSNIGGVSIYILDEAKNVECAREMLEKKDFIVPTFNDVLRTDKPSLHYYFMMFGFTIFGENAFGARFFSSLFGALTILITFLFTRKYAGKQTAFWTAVTLLASIHLSVQFHLAVPDPYLIFFITAAVLCFYLAVKERSLRYLLLMYISMGFGVLAKGPVAIGIPGLIFLLFLIFSRRFRWSEIRELKPFLGALLVLIIAAPWYVLVHIKTGGAWTSGFFLEHNLDRFSSPQEGHGGIFLITIAYVLAGMFPFSVFVIQAVRKAFRNRKNDFILFNLIAFGVVVIFFSFSSTKLPNYTVPAYPFMAILIAMFLKEASLKQLKVGLIVMLSVSVILIPTVFFGLKFDPALAEVNYLAWYFLPLPLGGFLAYYFYRKRQKEKSLVTMMFSGMATAIIFFCLAFPVIDQQNPVIKSQHLLEGKEVRYFERMNAAFPFALKKPVAPIGEAEFEAFFDKYPEGVIISSKKDVAEIDLPKGAEVSFSSRDIFETPTTVLISQKPMEAAR